jgi:uncharacterized protein YndB with AHSA1/START domain
MGGMASVPWPGPRRSVETLAAQHGSGTVVDACLDLLAGRDVDGQILFGLGGPPARWAIDGGAPGPAYWLKVWALRGLLWLWDDRAAQAVAAALADEQWRVREMAARVSARHKVEASLPDLLRLCDDPVPRVQKAARHAAARLQQPSRMVSASREINAPADEVFELIADPAQQPRWDGNDNLSQAETGQRVRAVGDVFVMTLRRGGVRENTVVEFEEGRRIAWRPCVPGKQHPGHLWRWELEPIDQDRTQVTHTYDWTELTDRSRYPRARATTADWLAASLARLASLAENEPAD